LNLLAPKDAEELGAMLEFALKGTRPLAIRYPRGAVPEKANLFTQDYRASKIQLGKAEILRQGENLAIISLGSMVYPSLEAAKILSAQKAIECTGVNARFAKPLDEALMKKLCAKFNTIIVAEEGICEGGFGSSILEFLEKEKILGVNIKRIALPCAFITHARRSFLLDRYGLSAQGIVNSVLEQLNYGKAGRTYSGRQNSHKAPKV